MRNGTGSLTGQSHPPIKERKTWNQQQTPKKAVTTLWLWLSLLASLSGPPSAQWRFAITQNPVWIGLAPGLGLAVGTVVGTALQG